MNSTTAPSFASAHAEPRQEALGNSGNQAKRRAKARADQMPDWMEPVDRLQEHRDHEAGAASDQQNAYALSSMWHRDGMDKVRALVKAGFHVVVIGGPAYCRFTDALIGTSYYVMSHHLIRAVAEFRCAKAAAQDEGSECSYEVYPLPERVQPAEVAGLDDSFADDLPF